MLNQVYNIVYDCIFFFVFSTCDLPWILQLVSHPASPFFFPTEDDMLNCPILQKTCWIALYYRRHADLIYLSGDLCRFLFVSSGNSSPQISTVIILSWGIQESKSELIILEWPVSNLCIQDAHCFIQPTGHWAATPFTLIVAVPDKDHLGP